MSSTVAVEEAQILLTMRDFFEVTGRAECVAALEKCPGISPKGLPDQLQYIRELVLRGCWDELLQFLEPLAGLGDEAGHKKCRYTILKHQYLESVASLSTLSASTTLTTVDPRKAENERLSFLIGHLHKLEQLCPSHEDYTTLCSLLTLPSLAASSEYSSWELYSARLQCFYDVTHWVAQVLYPGQNISGISASNAGQRSNTARLTQLLVKGLLYEECESKCSQRCGTAVGNREVEVLDLCGWIQQQPDSAFQLSPSKLKLVVLPHTSLTRKRSQKVLQVSTSLSTEASKQLTLAVEKPTLVSRSVPQLSGAYTSSSGDENLQVTNSFSKTTAASSIKQPLKSSKDGELSASIKPSSQQDLAGKMTNSKLSKETGTSPRDFEDNFVDLPAVVTPATSTLHHKVTATECGRNSSTPKPHSVIPVHPALPTSPVPYIPATHTTHPPLKDTAVSGEDTQSDNCSTAKKQLDFSGEETALSSLQWPNPKLISTITDNQVVRSIAFSKSGELVAVGANSKTLRLCSTQPLLEHSNSVCEEPPVLYHHPRYHRGSIYCLAWLEDTLLASGSNDQTINLLAYNPSSSSPYKLKAKLSEVHSGTVRDLAFLPSPPHLVSGGSGDPMIKITDCTSCKVLSSLGGHTEQVLSLTVVDENIVASSSQDKTLKLWDVRRKECFYTFQLPTAAGAISAHSNKLASSHLDGTISIFDLTSMKTLASLQPHTDEARSIRFSPDGKWLLSGSYDSRVCLIDAGCLEEWREMGQHDSKVIQCRWHCSGRLFASTGADLKACFWELND